MKKEALTILRQINIYGIENIYWNILQPCAGIFNVMIEIFDVNEDTHHIIEIICSQGIKPTGMGVMNDGTKYVHWSFPLE